MASPSFETRRTTGRRTAGPGWRPAGYLALLLVLFSPAAAAAPQRSLPAPSDMPEESLLDVGIQVFDDGLPDDLDALLELALEGIFEAVRKSEAHYLPVRMMETLQAAGYWGGVRVVPLGTDALDLTIAGKIVESNGRKLVLEIRAHDATGRAWIDRTYKKQVDPRVFEIGPDGADPGARADPFRGLYERIANDLLAVRAKLDPADVEEIRSVGELRFAADVLPAAFAGYLEKNRHNRLKAVRLPAVDDPLYERVFRLRDRDKLLIDTLNEYYTGFSAQMAEPYAYWLEYSYQEQQARAKIKRQARGRQVLGALAVLGGVILASEGGEDAAVLSEAAVQSGSALITNAIMRARRARVHVLALRELAANVNAEVEPLLLDVEGQTLRLTGSIEVQYAAWRRLLREYFATETGFIADP